VTEATDFWLGDAFATRVSFESVTLCIAAICENESKIVTVSDYLVSTPSPDAVQYETPYPKFVVSPQKRWLTMFTGDTDVAFDVWRYVRNAMAASGDESLASVKSIHKTACEDACNKKQDELTRLPKS
jgi:hypothetical protein